MTERMEIVNQAEYINEFTGVYFLIDVNMIVYIGSSWRIHRRLINHLYDSTKDFNMVTYIEVQATSRLDLQSVEAEYILKHTPKYNISIPENNRFLPLNHKMPPELLAIRTVFKVDLLKANNIDLINYYKGTPGGIVMPVMGSMARFYYDNKKNGREVRMCLMDNLRQLEQNQREYDAMMQKAYKLNRTA